jgi:hypothetical protein
MGLSRWYDETPLRVLRWINSYRYGWIAIAAIIAVGVAIIGLISGWLVAQTNH